MKTRKARPFIALVSLLLLAALSAEAQTQEEAQLPTNNMVTPIDPTDFFTRLMVRNEYRSLQSGREINLFIPRLEYALSKTFQVWVEAPVVHVESMTPETGSETGLGDILFRGVIRAVRAKRYAAVLGADLILDTASEPILGTGKYQFGPLVFASIEVPHLRSTFFPFYQHYVSFAGDNNRPDINYASIRPSVILTKWPNRFYTVIDPNFFIDFERDMDSGMTLEFEIGRALSKNVNVWIRPGVGIYGDIPPVCDWNVEGGIRYYFR